MQPLKPSPNSSERSVNCPQCGKPSVWHTSNPHRPFCSERCKLIDLGQWATEGYRIPQAQDESGTAPSED